MKSKRLRDASGYARLEPHAWQASVYHHASQTRIVVLSVAFLLIHLAGVAQRRKCAETIEPFKSHDFMFYRYDAGREFSLAREHTAHAVAIRKAVDG